MPVYVYKCDTCGVAFERKQSVTEGPLTQCPECEGRVRRVYQPVGVVFKGSGFYVTDNRAHSPTSTPPSSSSGSDGSSSSSDSSSSSKSPESASKDD